MNYQTVIENLKKQSLKQSLEINEVIRQIKKYFDDFSLKIFFPRENIKFIPYDFVFSEKLSECKLFYFDFNPKNCDCKIQYSFHIDPKFSIVLEIELFFYYGSSKLLLFKSPNYGKEDLITSFDDLLKLLEDRAAQKIKNSIVTLEESESGYRTQKENK